jgi:hypothetical protein
MKQQQYFPSPHPFMDVSIHCQTVSLLFLTLLIVMVHGLLTLGLLSMTDIFQAVGFAIQLNALMQLISLR